MILQEKEKTFTKDVENSQDKLREEIDYCYNNLKEKM